MKNKMYYILILMTTFIFVGCSEQEENGAMSGLDEHLKTEKNIQTFEEVKIGTQTWLLKNLNVDKFRNGDSIPYVESNEEWKNAALKKQPAWCYYDNDPANGLKYGKLYNWYAVNDSRGLAPHGWHIPSEKEWVQLINYLGEDVGGKMKSINGWLDNGNGNNESGFSGMPSGSRELGDGFGNIELNGNWWSSTQENDSTARGVGLYNFTSSVLNSSYSKGEGISVRCIKD